MCISLNKCYMHMQFVLAWHTRTLMTRPITWWFLTLPSDSAVPQLHGGYCTGTSEEHSAPPQLSGTHALLFPSQMAEQVPSWKEAAERAYAVPVLSCPSGVLSRPLRTDALLLY